MKAFFALAALFAVAAASDSYGPGLSASYGAPEKLVILRAPAPRPIKLIKTYPSAGDRYFIISSKSAYPSAPLAASMSSYGGASLSASAYAAPAQSSYAAPALVHEAYEAPSYDSAGPALASGYESAAPAIQLSSGYESSGYESSGYENSAPAIQLVAAHPAPSYESSAAIEVSAGPSYEAAAPAYESSAPAYSAPAYAAPTLIAVAAPSSYESAHPEPSLALSADYKK